jgi:hypothetical protein
MNQRRNLLQLLNWQFQLHQQQNVNNMIMLQVLQIHSKVQIRRRERRTIPCSRKFSIASFPE